MEKKRWSAKLRRNSPGEKRWKWLQSDTPPGHVRGAFRPTVLSKVVVDISLLFSHFGEPLYAPFISICIQLISVYSLIFVIPCWLQWLIMYSFPSVTHSPTSMTKSCGQGETHWGHVLGGVGLKLLSPFLTWAVRRSISTTQCFKEGGILIEVGVVCFATCYDLNMGVTYNLVQKVELTFNFWMAWNPNLWKCMPAHSRVQAPPSLFAHTIQAVQNHESKGFICPELQKDRWVWQKTIM